MYIRIRANSFELPEALRSRIVAQLHLLLSRYGHRILRAEVTLSRESDSADGKDKALHD